MSDDMLQNLLNLTFLDLSNNLLGSISADAFASVPKLQVLILRENRISSSHMYSLQGLQSLRKLDLSSNVIVGPLHSKFAPGLSLLSWFSMSKNQLSSIKRDALSGFSQLTTLLLQDNHIDVIEDFAFRSISQLNHLDLSYNRIVAISNSSLAFLSKLSTLDISHNFLRTVTNDLILPLRGLHELHLDDNDISLVASDALHSVYHLNRLTISENPLNCDCSVIYFATWLNSSNLTQEDRSTAICATPPSFENALLADLSITDLTCPSSTELLTSSSNYTMDNNSPFISLDAYNYVPSEVTLIWNIQKEMLPYICDTLVTYEKLDAKEVLLESRHIECNSSDLTDGTLLPITLTSSVILDGHLYRFCIALKQESSNTQSACSRVLSFSNSTNDNSIQTEIISEYIDKIEAMLITPGTLNVTLKLRDIDIEQCLFLIRIFNLDELLTEQIVNCSNIHIINNVLFSLSYRVCISFSNNTFNPVCTWVYSNDISRNNANHIILITALFCLFLLFLGIFMYGVYCTRCRFKRRLFNNSNNYLFPPVTCNQENASYSKLQAVTTL